VWRWSLIDSLIKTYNAADDHFCDISVRKANTFAIIFVDQMSRAVLCIENIRFKNENHFAENDRTRLASCCKSRIFFVRTMRAHKAVRRARCEILLIFERGSRKSIEFSRRKCVSSKSRNFLTLF